MGCRRYRLSICTVVSVCVRRQRYQVMSFDNDILDSDIRSCPWTMGIRLSTWAVVSLSVRGQWYLFLSVVSVYVDSGICFCPWTVVSVYVRGQ